MKILFSLSIALSADRQKTSIFSLCVLQTAHQTSEIELLITANKEIYGVIFNKVSDYLQLKEQIPKVLPANVSQLYQLQQQHLKCFRVNLLYNLPQPFHHLSLLS